MCQVSIKEISKCNLEECINVIRSSFGTVAEDFGLTTDNCPTNAAFIQLKYLQKDYSKGNMMYGLFIGEKIAGFMQLEFVQAGEFCLKNVAVVPEHRHKGYGEALLKFVKSKVIELGGSIIKIGIIEENKLIKHWYKKHGFIHTGTRKFEHLPFTVGFMHMIIDN